MSAENILSNLNPGCEFSLIFKEKSSYSTDKEYTTSTEEYPSESLTEVHSRTVAVGIYTGGSVHAGTMTVAVWGF